MGSWAAPSSAVLFVKKENALRCRGDGGSLDLVSHCVGLSVFLLL